MNLALTHAEILDRLNPPAAGRVVDVVLDTDTYNEIDDQFALAYALLATERINLRAVVAAPFENARSTGPGDGMNKSYDEILRVLGALKRDHDGLAVRGSVAWLSSPDDAPPSAGRDHIIELARAQPDDQPLYVVAIAAATNVAAAINAAPDIRRRIVVCWLGGHPLHWPSACEFNLQGDPVASRVLLDCGVPLVLLPCLTVSELLTTTLAELRAQLAGNSLVGDYLVGIFENYEQGDTRAPGASKAIWDLAPLAWLVDSRWAQSSIRSSPILTRDLTWSHDGRRHPIRVVDHLVRDGVFHDFFLRAAGAQR